VAPPLHIHSRRSKEAPHLWGVSSYFENKNRKIEEKYMTEKRKKNKRKQK